MSIDPEKLIEYLDRQKLNLRIKRKPTKPLTKERIDLLGNILVRQYQQQGYRELNYHVIDRIFVSENIYELIERLESSLKEEYTVEEWNNLPPETTVDGVVKSAYNGIILELRGLMKQIANDSLKNFDHYYDSSFLVEFLSDVLSRKEATKSSS